MALRGIYKITGIVDDPVCTYVGLEGCIIQGESKKSGISKSMYIALRAIKIKQIKF